MAAMAVVESQRLWRFSRTKGWRIIKEVMEQAGIQGVHATAKGLRHGFGIRCALMKIPVSQIQYWMGHSDSSTTAIYLEAKDEEEREMMERTWGGMSQGRLRFSFWKKHAFKQVRKGYRKFCRYFRIQRKA